MTQYEARKSVDGWYVCGPCVLFWRCPSRELAEMVAAMLNRKQSAATDWLNRWADT